MSIGFPPGHVFTPGPDSGGWTQQPPMVVRAQLIDGRMVAAAQPTGAAVSWQVYRITVQAAAADGGSVGSAFLRVDGQVVDGTTTGSFDIDEASPAIFVPAGSTIDVIWPDLTDAGDTATARLEYLAGR